MPPENSHRERAKPDKCSQFGRFGNRREGRLQRIALQVENSVGAVYFRDKVDSSIALPSEFSKPPFAVIIS